jgi:hypothetical protein
VLGSLPQMGECSCPGVMSCRTGSIVTIQKMKTRLNAHTCHGCFIFLCLLIRYKFQQGKHAESACTNEQSMGGHK